MGRARARPQERRTRSRETDRRRANRGRQVREDRGERGRPPRQPRPRLQPLRAEVGGEQHRRGAAHHVDQQRPLRDRPHLAPQAAVPPRVGVLVQHSDHGDPRTPQNRKHRGDEQRQAAVGEGEDRVVQQDRVRSLARQLAAERPPPRADLGPSATHRLLAAVQPVQRVGDLLAAQSLGEQQRVVARAAGRPHGHADDSNAQRRCSRGEIGLAPPTCLPTRVSRRLAPTGSSRLAHSATHRRLPRDRRTRAPA